MSLRTAFSPIFRTSTRGTGRAFSTSPVAAKHYLEATPAQFETVITQDRVVLVDFFATWCGPCKVLTPILKSTINEDGSADLVTIDSDDHYELASKYKITALPTVIAFRNGEQIGKFVGGRSAAGVQEFLDEVSAK